MWPRLLAAMSPAWVRSRANPASYSAIRANMPKTSLPWAVVVSMIPLVSDCTRRLTLPGCRPDRGSSGRCSHRDRDRRHRFFRMAAGVQGTGDAQHVRPMGLDPERERGEVGGALPTGRRVRSRGKFFSHQGQDQRPLIGTQPLPRSVTCATTPPRPGKARTSTSPGPTSPEARSARTTQIFVAGQSRLPIGMKLLVGNSKAGGPEGCCRVLGRNARM